MQLLWIFVLTIPIINSALAPSSLTATALANAAEQAAYNARPIDSIFLKFPTQSDLQAIIFSADSLALVKLIQTIQLKGEDVPCDALVVYSDQVIGMIKVVIESKNLAANQLAAIISSAEQEIKRIQNEISRLQSQQKSLKLSEQRRSLESIVATLDQLYSQYNAEKKKLTPLEASYQGYKKQIGILQSDSDTARAVILQQKLEVSEDQVEIAKLQEQLAVYKNNRLRALNTISQNQKKLQQNEAKLLTARTNIQNLNTQITAVNSKSDQIKRSYSKLEVEVERIRTDVSIATAKQYEILVAMEGFKDRLVQQQNKLLYQEEQNARSMASALSKVLPNFVSQNQEIYYQCFGEGNVEGVRLGTALLYFIRGEQLSKYLSKVYEYTNGSLSFNKSSSVRLYTVNIFGDLWVNTYGPAFTSTELVQSSAFALGDFTCLNPSQVQSGSGTITKIQNGSIFIQGSNNWQLNLGACSRVEAIDVIPKVGQKIVFKGIFHSDNNIINLYTATCF